MSTTSTLERQLAHQLARLERGRRGRPVVLWFQDGRRVCIAGDHDVRVRTARGTISIAAGAEERDVALDGLVAIELRPRPASPHRSEL